MQIPIADELQNYQGEKLTQNERMNITAETSTQKQLPQVFEVGMTEKERERERKREPRLPPHPSNHRRQPPPSPTQVFENGILRLESHLAGRNQGANQPPGENYIGPNQILVFKARVMAFLYCPSMQPSLYCPSIRPRGGHSLSLKLTDVPFFL